MDMIMQYVYEAFMLINNALGNSNSSFIEFTPNGSCIFASWAERASL